MRTSKSGRLDTNVLSARSLVRTAKIAQHLGVHPRTVCNYIGSGYLLSVSQGDDGEGGQDQPWHILEWRDGVWLGEWFDRGNGSPWGAKFDIERTPAQFFAWRAKMEALGCEVYQQPDGDWTVGSAETRAEALAEFQTHLGKSERSGQE